MNPPKRILIVNDGFPPDTWGGAATIALLQARGLREGGHDVRVFTTAWKEGIVSGPREYDGIPVYVFPTRYHPRWWAYRSLYNPDVLPAFRRELEAFSPEIVHFHNVHHFFSYHAIAVAKRSGAKVFLTAHDVMSFAYQKLHHFIDYSSKEIPRSFNYRMPILTNLKDSRFRFNPFRNLIIRHYLRMPDRIFAVSDALKQALADNGIVGNVSTLHNGLDADASMKPFDEEALRKELDLTGAKTVLFVGRFTPDKGRDVLLRAFARVAKENEKARLLVVGFTADRTEEPVMWKLIDGLDLEERIHFVPYVSHDDIYKYYRISQVVAVPSVIFDSFPTANLEAMAAGKPVIATCFGGSSEAVEDQVTGYVINPLDEDVFSEKLSLLLRDEEKARSMGALGQQRLRDSFSLERQLEAYLSAYETTDA